MPAQPGACSVHVTPREIEVLNLLAMGFGDAEIGETIGIATGTVKHYVNQLGSKLDLHSRVLLASYWGSCEIFRIGAGWK